MLDNSKGKLVLEKIKKELKLDDDMIKKIGDVFEKNFLSGKNNKETILDELMKKVGIDKKTANKIYNKFMSVVGNGIKDKIIGFLKKK